MVCVYCGSKTETINSRLQKRRNSVWRRRRCQTCGAVFTSIEQVAYDLSLAFEDSNRRITAFQREALFLSLYEACRHRPHAIAEAADLTDTVIRRLLNGYVHDGAIRRADLLAVASETLGAFDNAAQTHYAAYHPL